MGAMDPLREAYEIHYASLLRLCLLLTGGREGARDLAQDVFVRVAPRISLIDPERVGAYLRRTAINLWKNSIRRLAVDRRLRARYSEAPREAEHAMLEEHASLWLAILRLPSRQRACLFFRYYEDLPEKKVAEILGCSIGTVKSSTSRALTRLRKELSDED